MLMNAEKERWVSERGNYAVQSYQSISAIANSVTLGAGTGHISERQIGDHPPHLVLVNTIHLVSSHVTTHQPLLKNCHQD